MFFNLVSGMLSNLGIRPLIFDRAFFLVLDKRFFLIIACFDGFLHPFT